MLSQHVERMCRALDAEAGHRRTWEGHSKVRLEAGRQDGQLGQRWRYDFRLSRAQSVRTGVTGTLHANEIQSPAVVHQVDGSRVTMLVDEDVGRLIVDGVFAADLSFLMSKARDNLKYRFVHGPMNRVLAGLAVLGSRMEGLRPPSPGWKVNIDLAGLDPTQADAVERSTRQPVMHLWGPAGTGKSETLAAIAANVVANKGTLLLSAHTNLAVDTLLKRALQRSEVRVLAQQGRVVRLGPIRSPSLRDGCPTVSLEALVRQEREAIEESMEEVGRALAELRRDPSGGLEDGETRNRYRALEQEAGRLERLHASTPERTLAKAEVIAATVTRVTLGQVERMLDAVILDEASQVCSPLAFSVAGFARKSVVLAGDFRQLAPVVGTRDVEARRCLGESAFESCGVAAAVRQGRSPDHLHVLQTQYRLPRAIHELSSNLFYGGLTAQASECRRSGRVSYFDTSPFHFRSHIPRDSYSRVNPRQAELVVAIARELARNGGPLPAIISPYVAQGAALRKRLRRARLSGAADTVHRFQGQERPLVILDLTDAPGTKPSHFARATRLDEDGVRLLCVAITRPSDHLVVVGDFAYLLTVLPPRAFLRRLIHEVTSCGRPLPLPDGWHAPEAVG